MAPCKFINSGRLFPYGEKCKFDHSFQNGGIPQRTRKPNNRKPVAPLSTSEAELRAWRLSIPRAPFTSPTTSTLERFFQNALRLMNDNASIQQDVIKGLAS